MAGKEEREPRLFKWGAWIFGFVAVVLVGEAIIIYWTMDSWSDRGTFGDTFGAANALFSGLAFGGVIVAILLQRKELELQRKELELTRNELARTAEAQENSEKIFQRQLYYSFLASKIEALNTAINFYSHQHDRSLEEAKRTGLVHKDAYNKMLQCNSEIEEILETFRKANFSE